MSISRSLRSQPRRLGLGLGRPARPGPPQPPLYHRCSNDPTKTGHFYLARNRTFLFGVDTENVVIVIPPRRSAVSAGPTDGPWAQRDTALERIRQVGRREWQKESGYRQQARVENSFFRYKPVLGGGLKARHKGEKLRSGVTSSTGWPSWVGRNPALWCPEREVGKAPPLAPQLNHATAPLRKAILTGLDQP